MEYNIVIVAHIYYINTLFISFFIFQPSFNVYLNFNLVEVSWGSLYCKILITTTAWNFFSYKMKVNYKNYSICKVFLQVIKWLACYISISQNRTFTPNNCCCSKRLLFFEISIAIVARKKNYPFWFMNTMSYDNLSKFQLDQITLWR